MRAERLNKQRNGGMVCIDYSWQWTVVNSFLLLWSREKEVALHSLMYSSRMMR